MYADLKSKTAVITGAGKESGIGYAIARKLAASGANVVITDVTKAEDAQNQLSTCRPGDLQILAGKLARAYGIKCLGLNLDVTCDTTIARMVAALKAEFDHVHILCNNAGTVFGVPNALHTYAESAWQSTIDVNLNGVFRVSKAIVPLMSGGEGSIINSASQAGKKPPLFNGAYAVAKAGVIMLTKVMAMELAGSGIRVNAVCPGVILSDFTKWRFELEAQFLDSTPALRQTEKCKEIPLGRLGRVDEVANLVAFLASSESSYITGQALNITGGQLMEL